MSVDEVLEVVKKDWLFYIKSGGGVTFSGGEPLVQHKFLRALLTDLVASGIHTAVETCGYAPWSAFDSIQCLVNLFLYDVKILDKAKHREVSGVGNELILSNLKKLVKSGNAVTVRIPVIPGYTSIDSNIHRIFEFIASLDHIRTVNLLPYHQLAKNKYSSAGKQFVTENIRPPDQHTLDELVAHARQHGLECTVGG